jgi:UPF0271 protein
VLLNIDLGELDGEPEELYRLAHIANVACGGHAGDDASMRRALELCLRYGTSVGAHPSFPDRAGFGRAPMAMSHEALRATVAEQCRRLAELAAAAGARVAFVKAHGALYHAAREDEGMAAAVLGGAVAALGKEVTVIGPPSSAVAAVAAREGVPFAREGFADRATRPDGTLVPRGQPGAVITDPEAAASRAALLARTIQVDTICVHGDTPGAVAVAAAVRRALEDLEPR